jgi:hypothetical protein
MNIDTKFTCDASFSKDDKSILPGIETCVGNLHNPAAQSRRMFLRECHLCLPNPLFYGRIINSKTSGVKFYNDCRSPGLQRWHATLQSQYRLDEQCRARIAEVGASLSGSTRATSGCSPIIRRHVKKLTESNVSEPMGIHVTTISCFRKCNDQKR